MATKTQILANQRFVERAYDRIVLTIPKGDRVKVKDAAAKAGESMNEYVKRALYSRMEQDADKGGQ